MGFEGRNFERMYQQAERLAEQKNYISELDRVLAKLIETGAELDPMVARQMRQYVQQLLRALGVRSYEELFEKRAQFDVEIEYLPIPPTYPTKKDFQKQLLGVVLNRDDRELPYFPGDPLATDVAEFAQYNWMSVDTQNGEYTLDYLYELGKIMVSPTAYGVFFPQGDSIVLDSEWNVQRGPHRALVLRTLGRELVELSGMNSWVQVG